MDETAVPPGAPHLVERVRELEATTERLAVLLETGRLLASEISLDRLLTVVMDEVTRVLDAERSTLFLYDHVRNELYSKIAQGIDVVEIRFAVDRGLAGHVARSGQRLNIADAYQDPRFNPEFDRESGFRTHSMLVVPLKNRRGEVLGVVQALNRRNGQPFDEEDANLLEALASQAAISIENAQLYERIEGLFDSFVQTIVKAIDARDPTTSGHSHRVAAYAINLARSLHHSDEHDLTHIEFSREGLKALRYAGLLHDVGKIGVRESVLCKRYTLLPAELALVEERARRAHAEAQLSLLRGGDTQSKPDIDVAFYSTLIEAIGRRRYPVALLPADDQTLRHAHTLKLLTDRQFRCLRLHAGNLDEVEWEDMASHVTQSYELLRQIPWPTELAKVPEIAWSHHERLDGTGYPRGVSAAEFPLEGQLLAVADIFDALTASDRPYKRSYSRNEARGILEDEVARHRLDGRLVRVFFAHHCDDLPPETPRPASAAPPDAEL